jgi:amino acid transporter
MNTETSPAMERRFGLLQATALNMSNMLGAGPFITIPLLMSTMGGPQAMLGWVVALVITLADGLVWSELGAAMPHSGGTYGYLRASFGKHWGPMMAFLFIWQLILSGPLEIASGCIGFGQYLRYLWPAASDFEMKCAGATMAAVVMFLLYRQIQSIAKLTVSLWIGVLVCIVVVIVSGLMHFDAKVAFDFPPNAFQFSWGFLLGLGAASRVGIYDYLGYYDVCYIGDEVKDPGRVIPRSVMLSLVGVALIYMAVNLSIIGTLSWREFVPAADPLPPVASLLIEKIHGRGLAQLFTLLVLWTIVACVFALLLGYSRIPYAAARDGNFFKAFAQLHPTGAFPHRSLLVLGGLSITFTFLPLMTVIDALLTTRMAVQFIGQVGALLWLRKHQPTMQRPFRMWLYPVPAFVALVGWLYLIATQSAIQQLQALGFLVAGGVCYLFWRKLSPRTLTQH